ncbi:MAG: hypothetical protein RMI56_04050 [Sulfolobales archaeon]|nr:hypothetical protein [Sulfolobales archaeon]MDW8082956.1 hypothetical protein [Sulfolobales archaeon]
MKIVDHSNILLNSASVDAASASLYLNGNYVGIAGVSVASSNRLLVYPPISSGHRFQHPFISSLRKLEASVSGITDRYIELGIPYEEDQYIDSLVLESDVRLSLELYGLGVALDSSARYILIDGPLLPPARSYLKLGYWADEVSLFNSKRVQYISRTLSEDRVVVGFVKRVGIDISEIESLTRGRPAAIGPIVTKDLVDICSFYIVTESSSYLHSLGRVEIPCATVESLKSVKLVELLSMFYSSCFSLALPVPYGLYVADRVSKNLVRKLVELVELAARSRGIYTVFPGEYMYG